MVRPKAPPTYWEPLNMNKWKKIISVPQKMIVVNTPISEYKPNLCKLSALLWAWYLNIHFLSRMYLVTKPPNVPKNNAEYKASHPSKK